MKHTLKITLMLVLLFFVAQIVGLLTVNNYIQVETQLDGTIEIVHVDTVVGEQPDIPNEEKPKMVLFIVLAILFGTGLILLLIKFRLGKLWKLWFFLAIALTL